MVEHRVQARFGNKHLDPRDCKACRSECNKRCVNLPDTDAYCYIPMRTAEHVHHSGVGGAHVSGVFEHRT